MALSAKVRASAYEVPFIQRSEVDFSILAFFDLGPDVHLWEIETVRDILAMEYEHDGFALFQGDLIWAVGKPTRGDLDAAW